MNANTRASWWRWYLSPAWWRYWTGHLTWKLRRHPAAVQRDYPGYEGSVGPFKADYGKPHVSARSVHSGAGNCVCGLWPGHRRHVEIAPGVPVPERLR